MDLDPDACYRAVCARDARFDGRLVFAVRTTGIYCRPVCPARTPRRENVDFFVSAAAARAAGYRACLRCHPDAVPAALPRPVTRALALIDLGALDHDGDAAGAVGVEALAARVGVGARQLRRLFRDHVGVSPLAVAQARRMQLAREWVATSMMPLTEIAMLAGFGSLRRFQSAFVAQLGQTPSALRRASQPCAAEATTPASPFLRMRLPYRPPYDWGAMRAHLAARAVPGVEAVIGDVYLRTIAVGGATGRLRVAPGADAALHVECQVGAPAAFATFAEIVGRLRRQFDLDADVATIGAQLAADPLLAPRVRARPGLRVPGAWDGFELAARAILGQQITVRAAAALAGRLASTFGAGLPASLGDAGAGGLPSRLFPDASTLAEAGAARVAACGMPRARAEALVAMARAAQADPHLFDPAASLDEAVARFAALPGIGAWTAQYIAMRALREPDAFPDGDVALQRAMTGADGRRPVATALRDRAQAWRPWRAYAAQHLWTAMPA